MGSTEIPVNYLLYNSEQTKNPVIVVQIEGVLDILSNRPVGTRVRYGDPLLVYGEPGIVYGGLRPYTVQGPNNTTGTYKDYLQMDASSFTIGQRLEPEQGKASITTLNLAFIDKDEYMTRLVSPGIVIPEILGATVTILLGYAETSYPEDYFQIFRGVATSVDAGPGSITLGLSDPSVKLRQNLFYCAQTQLTAPVSPTDMTINVISNVGFFYQIVAPDGSFWPFTGDPICHCYIYIDSEYIECQPDSMDQTKFLVIQRNAAPPGVTPSGAASHDNGSTVAAAVSLGDSSNPQNALTMALQVLLSGWNGPWVSGITVSSIGPNPDPNPGVNATDFIIMPDGVDLVADYNLVAGDWFILSGSSISYNNGIYFQIVRFANNGNTANNIIYISENVLFKEHPTTATIAFRSQYDVYPIEAGIGLTPLDVDVNRFNYIENTFMGNPGNDLEFLFTAPVDSAKSWLESQVYLAVSAYSLTRNGLLSVGYTSPPIADTSLVYLTPNNILDPQNIKPQRATNNRAFFNEIDISYNPDDQGNYQNIANYLNSDSYNSIGILNVLPLTLDGLRPSGTITAVLQKRVDFLFYRYAKGATLLTVKVNWDAGSQIEAGDVVVLQDDGSVLQITNFNTGQRGLGSQLFEVIDRTFDLRSGNVSLKLINGLGAQSTDRFGVISPSSILDVGSTSTQLIILDSYGMVFPGDESNKWVHYTGQTLFVHSFDMSTTGTCTLLSVDPINNYALNITDLGFTPSAGMIVDIENYPTSNDPTVDQLPKILHDFLSPQRTVLTGVSNTSFTVSSGDITVFSTGATIRVHSVDYSSDSGDVVILSITGTTIVTKTSMGFTPSSGFKVDGFNFADGGSFYRFL